MGCWASCPGSPSRSVSGPREAGGERLRLGAHLGKRRAARARRRARRGHRRGSPRCARPATLRTVTALDQGRRPAHGPDSYLLVVSQVLPGWIISLLAGTLLLPVVVASVDAFARARRRQIDVLPWLRFVGAWVAPFLAALALAELLALTGATPTPPAPVPPEVLPLDGPALGVLVVGGSHARLRAGALAGGASRSAAQAAGCRARRWRWRLRWSSPLHVAVGARPIRRAARRAGGTSVDARRAHPAAAAPARADAHGGPGAGPAAAGDALLLVRALAGSLAGRGTW